MNPYEVLNVPSHGTDAEIKAAYRKLVKQYHPDRNQNENAKAIIQRINEAYDILSDADRRSRYDRGITIEFDTPVEEDPVEQYKRDYKRRKWEESQKKKVIKEERQRMSFKIMRLVCVPIALFSLTLIVDNLLPGKIYNGKSDWGWQKRIDTRSRGSRSSSEIISYMRTPFAIIAVPAEVHLDYDYFNSPGEVVVEKSLIYQVPKNISVQGKTYTYTFKALSTIYSHFSHIHYFLFASALFVLMKKEYTVITYNLCFLPLLLLAFTLLIMIG